MRNISFFDGASSGTVPTIGNIVASNLVQYANDAAFEAAELGAPTTGNIYYNTTLNLIRYYNATSWISIVDESSSQTLTNKIVDGNSNTITNVDGDNVVITPSGNLTATDAQAGLDEHQGDIDGLDTRLTTAESDILDKLDAIEKGAVNGVATLDGTGRVPSSQLPLSATEYKGTWDANTNTPTLADGVGTQGDFYVVTVAGTIDLGSGNITFGLADWAFYNGSTWELSTNSINVVGAATNLNNLVAPEVNVTLNPYADNAIDLGSSARSWRIVYGRLFLGGDGTTEFATDFNTPHDVQLHSGHSSGATNTGDTIVQSGDQLGIATGTVGDLLLESGEIFNAANANDTGDVIIKPGLTAGAGARGKVKVQNGTEGTIGHVLKSTDVNGSAEWAPESGGGQGGINYVINSDAEVDLSDVTDNSGVGGAVTTTRDTVNQLRGVASFNTFFVDDAAAGDNVSLDLNTIDAQDLGKTLNVSFDYATDADVAVGEFEVIIRDVTGAVDIVVGELLPTGALTNRSKFIGNFQVDDTNTDYEFRIQAKITRTGNTANIKFDTIVVGPETLVPGSIITKWTPWVPIFSASLGTVVLDYAEQRQVGEDLEIRGKFTTGTVAAGVATMSIPLANIVNSTSSWGDWRQQGNSTDDFTSGSFLLSDTEAAITFVDDNSLAVSSGSPFNAANANVIFRSSTVVSFNFTTKAYDSPGASFSTTEAFLSTAKARAVLSGTQTISSAAETQVEFDTKSYDNLNAFNTTNYEYTVPKTGVYNINIQVLLNSVTPDSNVDLIVRDGASGLVIRSSTGNSVNTNVWASVIGDVELTKGTTLEVFVDAGADASYTIGAGVYDTWFSISEVPDFSTFSVYGKNEFVTANSDPYTPTADTVWGQLTGNSITLPPGSWMINGGVDFGRSGTANYTRMRARWASVNGNNTATTPTGLTNLVAGRDEFDFFPNTNTVESNINMGTIRVVTTVETTIYLVPIATLGTFANGRINTNIYAERIA